MKTTSRIPVVLVDDEPNSRAVLRHLIQELCSELVIVGEADSIDSAYEVIEQEEPVCIFLDVEIKSQTGFDLLARYPELPFQVIFVSAFSHYAVQAIKLTAVDYLLKPVNPSELVMAVRKIKKQEVGDQSPSIDALLANINQGAPQKIAVPDQNGISYLDLKDITCFQANGNYCVIHKDTGQQVVSTRRIKEYEQLLHSTHFFRIHQSYMVDLSKVSRYRQGKGGMVVLHNGVELEVSRRKKTELLARLERMAGPSVG